MCESSEVRRDPYRFSRYAKTLARGGIVAVFNSLRMRPVYLEQRAFKEIQPLLAEGVYEDCSAWQNHARAFELLKDAKVIISRAHDDDAVLNRARNCVTHPFPHLFYLVVTDKCNMGCHYCFVRCDRPAGYQEVTMTQDTARAALDFYSREIHGGGTDEFNSEKQIIFYGGEPLLNFSVIEFAAKYCKELQSTNALPSDTRLSLVTNGTLLTMTMASFFKEFGMSVGISIDGDRIITDANRPLHSGESSYDRIVRAITLCQNVGLDVGLSVTVTPSGLDREDAILEEILRLNVRALGFNILMGDNRRIPEEFHAKAAQFLLKFFKVVFCSSSIFFLFASFSFLLTPVTLLHLLGPLPPR